MSAIISLAGFDDVQTTGDKDTTMTIFGKFVDGGKNYQAVRFAQSVLGGGVFLIEDERFPGKIVEVIASLIRPDEPVLTCYAPHPIFAGLNSIITAREKLNVMLHGMEDATLGRLTYNDMQRHRVALPVELSTMQLIRLLKKEIDPYFKRGDIA